MLDKKSCPNIRLKIKKNCLTNKLFCLEKKLKQFAWQKSFSLIVIKITVFIIVIKITVFFIINTNNQELIHHIHCFRCIFYHQSKTKKSCLFHRFLFYDLYFESYSSNVSNISYSTKHHYIRYDLLSQQHFYSHLLLFCVHYYHLPNMTTSLKLFNPTNSSIATPAWVVTIM